MNPFTLRYYSINCKIREQGEKSHIFLLLLQRMYSVLHFPFLDEFRAEQENILIGLCSFFFFFYWLIVCLFKACRLDYLKSWCFLVLYSVGGACLWDEVERFGLTERSVNPIV